MTEPNPGLPVATGPDGYWLWDTLCTVCQKRKLCQYQNRYICLECLSCDRKDNPMQATSKPIIKTDTRERAIAEMHQALELALYTYENVTTDQFTRGEDKPAREAMARALRAYEQATE